MVFDTGSTNLWIASVLCKAGGCKTEVFVFLLKHQAVWSVCSSVGLVSREPWLPGLVVVGFGSAGEAAPCDRDGSEKFYDPAGCFGFCRFGNSYLGGQNQTGAYFGMVNASQHMLKPDSSLVRRLFRCSLGEFPY